MARINLTFSRALANVKDNKIVLDAKNVKDLLSVLAGRYGERFNEEFYDENRRPKRFISIFVNGVEIRSLNGLDTVFKDNDNVVIIPVVTGG